MADLFGVNTSLIRFWEKEFPIIQPKKNRKGNRMFTVKDIENFNKIYILVKEKGYTLDGAKKVLKDKSAVINVPTLSIPEPSEVKESNQDDVIRRLEAIKTKLEALRNQS